LRGRDDPPGILVMGDTEEGSSAPSIPNDTFKPFSFSVEQLAESVSEASVTFNTHGLLHIQGILSEAVVDALHARIESELALRREDANAEAWFGDVYGFEEKGFRWDMKLTRSPAVRDALVSVIQVIKALLESRKPSWQLAELAAMCTFPGDPGQPVHADTSHIYDEQVVTIFVALHDIDITRGPTKMYPGSHVDGELHMGYRKPDEDAAVYCTMRKGDCAVMDSRLLHCGTANRSGLHRFLFYSSWRPPVRRPRGSTNTILGRYEDKFYLNKWQEWAGEVDDDLQLV